MASDEQASHAPEDELDLLPKTYRHKKFQSVLFSGPTPPPAPPLTEWMTGRNNSKKKKMKNAHDEGLSSSSSLLDDSSSSSSSNSSESGSDTDGTTKAASARKTLQRIKSRNARWKKKAIEAEKFFIRREGITYIYDELWNMNIQFAVNCHLYVGVLETTYLISTADGPSSEDVELKNEQDQSNCGSRNGDGPRVDEIQPEKNKLDTNQPHETVEPDKTGSDDKEPSKIQPRGPQAEGTVPEQNRTSEAGRDNAQDGIDEASKTAENQDMPPDRSMPRVVNRGRLPARVRIMNDLLQLHLQVLCRLSTVNTDQIAPFWVFVLNEDRIRKSLQEHEAKFSQIKENFPEHPAILRTAPCLPLEFADGRDASKRQFVLPAGDWDASNVTEDQVEGHRVLLDGLRALVQLLDNDLSEAVETNRRLQKMQLGGLQVPFSHLWYLFYPGCDVVSTHPTLQAYRCIQTTGGKTQLAMVHGRYVPKTYDFVIYYASLDFDGKEFGAKHQSIRIRSYRGLMAVTDLAVYPLAFAEPELAQRLISRGRKFEQLAIKARHRKYRGVNLLEEPVFDILEEIDSDVMIDFQQAYRSSEPRIPVPVFGPQTTQTGRPGVPTPPRRTGGMPRPGETQPGAPGSQRQLEYILDLPADSLGMTVDNGNFLLNGWQVFVNNSEIFQPHRPGTLTESSLLLLPIRVYGYALLNRQWFPLDIDCIGEVPKVEPGDNDGFQKLVLPEGHRDIVRALVNSYARQITPTGNVRTEFDVVKGKGKGLIILLHGAPGVGKTSTAECVAANAGRPLLPITCGDLGGISAKEVEQNLETFFILARKWGCVLLLDEADVFLGARDKGDIRQVSLVSVFLRVLEYYSGILILTTNRVGSFDEAIKSRVHCALYYPPLDRRQTLEIWRMNLDTLEERNKYEGPDTVMRVRFNRKEIERYAEEHWDSCTESMRWNGRQIKNAFQTAVALADWDHFQHTGGNPVPEGPLLKKSHFQTVSQASAHFDDYLMKVRGADQERAKMHEIRRDDIRVYRRDTGKKTLSHKATKPKAKKKAKPPPPPESSTEESEEESEEDESVEDEDESSAAVSEEEEEEEDVPPPPPPKKKKVASKRKKSRE